MPAGCSLRQGRRATVGKSVRTWGGNGYPPEDTPPLTEAEARQLVLRMRLQDADAGCLSRPREKLDPDAFRATGLPIEDDHAADSGQ